MRVAARCVWVADLDPIRRASGSIRFVPSFRDDAFEPRGALFVALRNLIAVARAQRATDVFHK
jgi:hypothetical protein